MFEFNGTSRSYLYLPCPSLTLLGDQMVYRDKLGEIKCNRFIRSYLCSKKKGPGKDYAQATKYSYPFHISLLSIDRENVENPLRTTFLFISPPFHFNLSTGHNETGIWLEPRTNPLPTLFF
jgi:hypothetical protein